MIAPAYAVFDDLAHAYAAAKAINAVLMSLAAVPVYLIARRLVSVPLALAASALALAIPSMVYTSTIMTENAFYPAFLLGFLALLAALERPTVMRQLGALAVVLVAFVIRAQAVTLLLGFVSAIALVCIVEARADDRLTRRELTRRLLEFRATWIALVVALVLGLGAEFARGRSPAQLLGGYHGLAESHYGLGSLARWFVLHAAELDLYVGVLPFAAFLVVALESFRRAALPRPLRLFGLLAVSVAVWMTLAVSVAASFFSAGGVGRIQERNLFYIAPLCFIALLAWVETGRFRVWPAAGLAALLAGALPGAIAYNDFANLTALSDTLVLIPLWNLVFFQHVEAVSVAPLVIAGSLTAALLFLLLPRRMALVGPVLVFGWFLLLHVTLERQIGATSRGLLQQGIGTRREWIDEKVGPRGRVAVLWSGNANAMTVLQNTFFNHSVRSIYAVGGVSPASDRPVEHQASVEEETGIMRADGRSVRAKYVLADSSLELAGPEVARDRGTGLVLYRVNGEVRVRNRIAGVYPDSWTGPEASYTRWGCRGGRLSVTVASQPGLFTAPQTVVGLAGKRVLGRVKVTPGAERTLVLPLLPEKDRCSLTLRVSPTAVPSQVLGTPDARELGVRVTALEDRPS